MLKDHAKIVRFMLLAGEVTGRKKLQKMIYIAKKMECSFHEKYNFHIYGPYSEELTVRVEELCNLGFIQEVKEDKGSYLQYRYSVTENGEQFISILEEEEENLSFIIQLMNDKSSRFLELVATLLYFDNLAREQQILKLKTVKAKLNYNDVEIKEAFAFIQQLNQQ